MSEENGPCGWDWKCISEKLVNLTQYNFVYHNENVTNQYCIDNPGMKYCWHDSPLKITVKVVALFVIMLFGIPANLSIITIILKNRLLRKQPNNLFLLNMAITDFLNLTVNTTLYFFDASNIFAAYYLTPFLCKLSPILLGE